MDNIEETVSFDDDGADELYESLLTEDQAEQIISHNKEDLLMAKSTATAALLSAPVPPQEASPALSKATSLASGEEKKTALYITNFGWWVSEEEIREVLERIAKISFEDAFIVTNPVNGKSRGIAILQFECEANAGAAKEALLSSTTAISSLLAPGSAQLVVSGASPDAIATAKAQSYTSAHQPMGFGNFFPAQIYAGMVPAPSFIMPPMMQPAAAKDSTSSSSKMRSRHEPVRRSPSRSAVERRRDRRESPSPPPTSKRRSLTPQRSNSRRRSRSRERQRRPSPTPSRERTRDRKRSPSPKASSKREKSPDSKNDREASPRRSKSTKDLEDSKTERNRSSRDYKRESEYSSLKDSKRERDTSSKASKPEKDTSPSKRERDPLSESMRSEKRDTFSERTSDKLSSHRSDRESRREAHAEDKKPSKLCNSIDSKPSSAASSKDKVALSASSSSSGSLSNSAQLVKDEKNEGNFVEMTKTNDRKKCDHDDPEDKRSSSSSIAKPQEREKPTGSKNKEFSIEVAPGQRIVRRKP